MLYIISNMLLGECMGKFMSRINTTNYTKQSTLPFKSLASLVFHENIS